MTDAERERQLDTTTHDSIPAETGKNDGDRTSGDCISRQQAIDTLRKMQTYKLFAGDDMLLIDQAGAQTELMMLPSVQPERKTGHWIESNPQDSKLCRLMTCSECGKAYIVNINIPYGDWTEAHKFCVECGADMRGEQWFEHMPSAQPALYGYNIEHLELIARVLQKEGLPPERVVEALTDIGRIVAIVSDEFEETLRKAVEDCTKNM